jgi:hypothetical protein
MFYMLILLYFNESIMLLLINFVNTAIFRILKNLLLIQFIFLHMF